MRIDFDYGPLGQGTRFCAPQSIITAQTARQVPAALASLDAALRAGKWIAGFARYELGYALIPKLAQCMPNMGTHPLLNFGVFDSARPIDHPPAHGAFQLGQSHPLWDFPSYAKALDTVRDYISAGDIYQANLTFPLFADFEGCSEALYERLKQRQSVPHGAYVDLGTTQYLCRSPELFFSLSAKGTLVARPMKGTIGRGTSPEADAKRKLDLAHSIKDRSENLMITDLLRNDLGRIAKIGSVHVPRLFEIETYATLHQMVSEIRAEIRPECHSIRAIFPSLFPCGSITGAPKIRAMEILSKLEAGPRDAYCGSIGWIAPDGAMQFNVAIRTVQVNGKRITLNVGGGVVYDSHAQGEYNEALLKARFFTDLYPMDAKKPFPFRARRQDAPNPHTEPAKG